MATDIKFHGDMLLSEARESFLRNEHNKHRFINHLSAALRGHGVETRHADGDADCLIVSTVLEKAKEAPTALVGQDTDLLVLLLHHTNQEHASVLIASGDKNWHVQSVQTVLGVTVCNILPFAHALGGCDTTRSLFSLSKGAILRKIVESPYLKQQAYEFVESKIPQRRQ